MRKLASLTLSLFLIPGMVFADSPKDAPKDSPKDAPKEAAAPAKTAATTATKTNAEIAAEMEELRQALQAQQEQLQMLKEELAKRDKEIEAAREAAAAANSHAAEASLKATEAVATSSEAKSETTELHSTVANMAGSSAAPASGNAAALTTSGSQQGEEKGPVAIRYKGVTITPIGFLAAETVTRQRGLSADINTQFNAIPYPGNAMSQISETNFTGRQSRLGVLVEGHLSSAKWTGYVETDFLGAGSSSNDRQSNSYVLRLRQGWGRIALDNGWAFSGGQMWTLATENRQGIENRQEVLPQTIDPNYQVGFNWARQYGVRATKSFGDKFTAAVSLEGSQATIGGHGFSTYSNTSATGTVTSYSNFFFNAPGSAGGLYNPSDTTGYTFNKWPDFIIKGAWDPSFGHFEVVGILSQFRSRIYPCAVVGTTAGNFPTPLTPVTVACPVNGSTTPSALGASNQTTTGGGVEVSGRLPAFSKKLDISLKGGYGTGTGRYSTGQLPDVTARYDGLLVPIKAANWLGKLEWHVNPKLDLYAYFGGEYAGRVSYSGYNSVKITNTPAIPGCGAVGQQPCPGGGVQPNYPALVTTSISETGNGGYGYPTLTNGTFNSSGVVTSGCSTELPPPNTGPSGSGYPNTGSNCGGDTRYLAEGTFGFWHKIYQGEKGRLQWGIQYSYVYRVAWSGVITAPAGSGIVPVSSTPKATDNMAFTSLRYYLP